MAALGRRPAVLAALVLLVLLALPGAASADAVARFLNTLDSARQDRGLGPVDRHPELDRVALALLDDLVRRRSIEPAQNTSIDRLLDRSAYDRIGDASLLFLAAEPDAATAARKLAESGSARAILRRDPNAEIGVAYRPHRLTLSDRRYTDNLWVILITSGPPDPVVDAIPAVLAEINRARARKGRRPVRLNAQLSAAAESHARDMVRRGYFAHESPEGGDLGGRVDATGYRYRKVSENLAFGQESAREVVDGWHGSPGHARNQYDPEVSEVGLAYLYGPIRPGGKTGYHVWVAVYGQPG
jgi:hypothetical protein